MMIAWLKYWSKRDDNERYVQFASRIFGTDLDSAIIEFEKMIADCDVQTRISEFGQRRTISTCWFRMLLRLASVLIIC